jgi:protein TonB
MSTFEKVGGFLLFEKIEEDRLSKDMLAGQISGNQIQQVYVVKRFDSSLATLPDFILDLNQEYEGMKSLSNPNIIRPTQFIHEKKEFAAVFDYVEGKSLRTVLNKCAQDGYPFTVDHALLVASRLCTALEYLHSKKITDQRLIHGYVSPEAILITYDGEIRLQYLGLAHALLKFPAGREKLLHDYRNYLAPELLAHQKWDRTIDIYGAGLVLYEMLTGEVLDRTQSIEDSINDAMMNSNSGEKIPLPDDLRKLLYQALALDPQNRFPSVADMRKALDFILFSSEFSPTTFNLAFFMHSLFRENIDEESKKIGLYKKTDFSAHLKPEPATIIAPTLPATPVKKPEPVAAKVQETHAPQQPARTIERKPHVTHPPVQHETFGIPEEKEKSKLPVFAGILVVVAVAAAIIYFFALKPGKSAGAKTPQPKPAVVQGITPEQLKIQEEERKKLEMDALKAQEEARKKDEELKALQAKLDALLKAQQEQAKKKTEAEKPAVDLVAIKKLQQEAKRLEEEKKEQQALAEQKLKEAQSAPPPPVQEPVTEQALPENTMASGTNPVPSVTDGGQTAQPELTQPAEQQPEPEPVRPSVVEGQVVDLTPDVVKPEILNRVNPSYPPIAQQKKIEGTVIIGILVSERGDVAEAKVLRGGGYGLNEAALSAVRKWKFRPAVKEGKRVKVWMTYPIVFKLGKV